MNFAIIEKMDKVALITGSSKGIGAVIAKNLASKGMKVVINYNSNEKFAREIVEYIGVNAISIKANIGVVEECKFLMMKLLKNMVK